MSDQPKLGPICCPFCGEGNVVLVTTWKARSENTGDIDNDAVLSEYQCRDETDCEGRSFWV